ncbi:MULTISPECIES: GNAT family N-acetyltransferase [unclassified Streptomyces]|uniref:GNAT family N-acetyltransferase n=1 Tax=unclassified Streptomyces TaxID=2593676 RepID=UPI000DAEDE36|nr:MULTISPECIES: GNAT family N-acetyltransferase [unclassified Streptomyces]PZT71867.1 GNAT family N-acetyltransferase [Streptomyces sp. AC1-42T]PZT81804.1 GNAT family N-acetyltransferase [Streptomyces sp. AC1-42W]
MTSDTATPGTLPAGADRVAGLTAAGWDPLVGDDDFFLSRRWMSVVESTGKVDTRYLTVPAGDGTPLAGVSLALADRTVPWTLVRPDTVLASSAGEGLPGAAELLAALGGDAADVLLPGVVAGGRHVGGNRVLLAPDAGPAEVARLLDRTEEWARSRGARSVSFLYTDESDTLLNEALTQRGYLAAEAGRYSRLDIPEGGFEDYLTRFTGHRRRRIRAERRALEAAGVEHVMAPLGDFPLPRLAALEAELFAKYGLGHWKAEQSLEVLERTLAVLGDDAFVSAAVADGEVRGFGLLAQHASCWYALRAGFDYAFQDKLPLYYETLYYRVVEHAARDAVHTVHYGLGSEDAKRSRGCTSTTQRTYVLPLEPDDRPARND